MGFLNEDFNLFMEDVDMAIRCRRKGWKLVTCLESIIYHKFHKTIASEEKARYWQETNRLLLIAKHWPDKLVDSLAGKYYFTSKGDYTFTNVKDISEILGKVFVKLIKEHGLEFTKKLSGDLFEAIRKIYNFEKDHLIQQTKDNNLTISAKNQELADKDNYIAEAERQIKSLEQKNTDISSELNAKNQELTLKDQQIISLRQDLESLKQEKNPQLTAKDQELSAKNQELTLLSQQKELELNNNKLLLQQARKELNDIYTSTGYKYLLKPVWDFLWLIKQFLKRIVRFIKKIILSIQALKLTDRLQSNIKFIKFQYTPGLFLTMLRIKNRWRDPWLKVYMNHLKKGTFPPKPDTLILMLTRKCNLTCKFCDIRNVTEEMKTEDAIKVIDNAYRLGIKWLIITGGEPFLHKGLFDIIEHAKSLNLKTSVTTNGSLISNTIDKIRSSQIDMVSVSLDGIGKTHDSLRGNDGLYEEVKSSVLELKKNKQNMSINFVVTNENVDELERLYNWAKNEGIVVDFWPVNFHKDLHVIQREGCEIFLKFVKKLKRNNEISHCKYYYYLKSLLYWGDKNHLKVRCLGLAKSLGVYVDGGILTCCVWGKEKSGLGNAIREDLESLWCSKKYWETRNLIYTRGCSAGCYNTSLQEFMYITGEDFMVSRNKKSRGE